MIGSARLRVGFLRAFMVKNSFQSSTPLILEWLVLTVLGPGNVLLLCKSWKVVGTSPLL